MTLTRMASIVCCWYLFRMLGADGKVTLDGHVDTRGDKVIKIKLGGEVKGATIPAQSAPVGGGGCLPSVGQAARARVLLQSSMLVPGTEVATHPTGTPRLAWRSRQKK